MNGEEAGGVGGHVMGGGFGFEVGGGFGEVLEVLQEFLAGLPFEESAAAPVAEVLGVDGVAVETLFEEGFDVRVGVEPLKERGGGGSVFETVVEFVAEGAGEAGDFSGAVHGE